MQNSTRLRPFGKTNASDTLLVQFQTFFRYKPVSLLRMSHFIHVTVYSGKDSAMIALFKLQLGSCKNKSNANASRRVSVFFPADALICYSFLKNSRAVAQVAWLN